MQSRRFSDISMISAIVALMLGFSASPAQATSSRCFDNGTVEVCAEWSKNPKPKDGTDLVVTFHGANGADVALKTGDLEWRLWTTLVSGGAVTDFGDLTLDGGSDDFVLQIYGDAGAGADDVGAINLVGTTGYSSLAAGTSLSLILGDVNGVITLVEDSAGVGGDLGLLLILGDVTGAITAPKVTASASVGGSVTGDILLGEVTGSLQISGSISGDLTVSEAITAGTLKVSGNIPSTSTVLITDITGASTLSLSEGGTNSLDGLLKLVTGIPAAATLVQINTLDGTVDLTTDDVVGHLRLNIGTVNARIINGGDVSGNVTLAYYYFKEFEGIATFDSIPSGGLVDTLIYAELTGELNILNSVAGTVHILGPFNSGGEINIGGTVSGLIELYDTAGALDIDVDLKGDVEVEGLLTGSIMVDGSLTGSITVDDSLNGSGEILVTGLTTGAISIGEETSSLTLIHLLGGLGTNGTVEINADLGNFNADGDIAVGPGISVCCPPPPTTFDGCIHIYDNSSEDYGDLNGDIVILGCHATNDDLSICIDGDQNGTIDISQTDCSNQVVASCDTCPPT